MAIKPGIFSTSNLFYILFCFILASPLLLVTASWLFPTDGGLSYITKQGLLWQYTAYSLALTLGAGFLALIIGITTAWAVTSTSMPARRMLGWLLILPFAMPGYVAAIVYADLLDSAGPIQLFIREATGLAFGDYWFPSIRSSGGAIFILAITLYPYVYLMAYTTFTTQSRTILETGQLLGLNHQQLFFRLMLPMGRPMLIVGLALVMMECLADFGVVSLFGIPTYTTGIYRAWQGLYDPIAAAQMASLLLIIVFFILWLERTSRHKARYASAVLLDTSPITFPLSTFWQWTLTAICLLIVILGFFLPLAILLYWTVGQWEALYNPATLNAIFHSVTLATLTAGTAGVIGIICAMMMRSKPTFLVRCATHLVTSGYAMPGSIVAVGILLLLITLQNDVLGGGHIMLIGTIISVVWACSFRFLTISFNSTEAGLKQVTPLMDDVAHTLGHSQTHTFTKVHLPIMYRSVLVGLLLVFIDTIKELPATILLRPFNFDTLAIRTYELASDELLQYAGPSALLLVLISIAPIWFIHQRMHRA